MKDNNGIKSWNYVPNKENEDAYEKIIADIQNISQQYLDSDTEMQNAIIETIFLKIREINVFPVIYFSEEGIKNEILDVYNKTDVCFVENGVYTQLRNGLLLLDFLFPNLHLATTCNEKRSMYDRFYDDNILKQAIRSYLDSGKIIHNLRTLFFSYARLYYDTPINFSPMRAKIIFEHYCPKNGTIYDYSAGYGGRMLGALCSQQNFKYIAVEPNSNTYYNLKRLGSYIEKVLNKENSYNIYNLCSEKFQLQSESIDFIFSCPPFFKKEVYSDEITQSIHNYPEYQDWLENYVRPTVRNSFIALKEKGVYGVDILNYTYCGKTYPLIEDWIRIAKEEGFVYKDKVTVASRFRKKENEGEYIYLFMKKEEYELPDYTPGKIQLDAQETRRRNERAKYRREHRIIGEYDIFGNLLELYSEDKCPVDKEIYKSNQLYNNRYYKIYYGEDIIQQTLSIKKPVCEIDDKYFFSLTEAGKYCGISRQAVAQARTRKAAQIGCKEVTWF